METRCEKWKQLEIIKILGHSKAASMETKGNYLVDAAAR